MSDGISSKSGDAVLMASGGGFERTRTQTGGGGSGEVGPSGAGDVSVMARDHIRGAVTWLEGLGDSPDYDGAWVDLVQSGFSSDPGVALVGALRLSDEGWREKYTRRYLARWMKSDKEAAQSWVAEYTEYLSPKVTRRSVPKPPKAPKTQQRTL